MLFSCPLLNIIRPKASDLVTEQRFQVENRAAPFRIKMRITFFFFLQLRSPFSQDFSSLTRLIPAVTIVTNYFSPPPPLTFLYFFSFFNPLSLFSSFFSAFSLLLLLFLIFLLCYFSSFFLIFLIFLCFLSIL